jgi:hypothetical protein
MVPTDSTYKGRLAMKIFKALLEGFWFAIEGVGHIFEPSHNEYPATGVIPYTGEPYSPPNG